MTHPSLSVLGTTDRPPPPGVYMAEPVLLTPTTCVGSPAMSAGSASPRQKAPRGPICNNCRAVQTGAWRRSTLDPGKALCNACGLFEKTHGRPRPFALFQRRRSLGPHHDSDDAGPAHVACPDPKPAPATVRPVACKRPTVSGPAHAVRPAAAPHGRMDSIDLARRHTSPATGLQEPVRQQPWPAHGGGGLESDALPQPVPLRTEAAPWLQQLQHDGAAYPTTTTTCDSGIGSSPLSTATAARGLWGPGAGQRSQSMPALPSVTAAVLVAPPSAPPCHCPCQGQAVAPVQLTYLLPERPPRAPPAPAPALAPVPPPAPQSLHVFGGASGAPPDEALLRMCLAACGVPLPPPTPTCTAPAPWQYCADGHYLYGMAPVALAPGSHIKVESNGGVRNLDAEHNGIVQYLRTDDTSAPAAAAVATTALRWGPTVVTADSYTAMSHESLLMIEKGLLGMETS